VSPRNSHSGAQSPTTPRRRGGRVAPQALTTAFRGYVERVQAVEEPTPRADLRATLILAAEIGPAGVAVDPSAVAEHGPAIRQLARSVRQAGRGAVAQPALLARAIVLARKLAAPSASDAVERRVLAGASR
jgi:hypothetical protein